MENFELLKSENSDNTNFEALRASIDEIELDFEAGFDEVEFQGNLYYINYVDDDCIDGPAEWRVSTNDHYDIDIEVRKSLGDAKIRRAILHEVIEADLSYYRDLSLDEAHYTASKFDRKYEEHGLNSESGV